MQPSTAQRESLINPLSLALLAGLFAVAFFVLKPDAVPGLRSLDGKAASGEKSAVVDELSLAYLRAQRSSGKTDDASLVRAVENLVNASRYGDARKLLDEYPQLNIGESLRFELDLEYAAANSSTSLYATLQTLVDTPRLQSDKLLQRARQLGKSLDQPRLNAKLHMLWAGSADSTEVSFARYVECGNYLAAINAPELARDCLASARQLADTRAQRFEVGLAMLPIVDTGSARQDALVQELVNDREIAPALLEPFADTLLQIGRPDMSYRIYARLALVKPAEASQWLPLAARWAEAAGRPAEAAVFLDSLARSSGADKPDAAERQQLFQKVETLLLAAGQTRKAYENIQARIRNNPGEVDVLKQGIVLARQLGESSQALAWNTQVLSFEPDNEDAVRLQRELAMAAGNLPLALRWAKRVVEQQPDSLAEREMLARITEWNGQPAEALIHWQWLARRAELADQQTAGVRQKEGAPVTTGAAIPAMGAALSEDIDPTGQNARIKALREVVRLADITLQPGLAAQSLREITRLEAPGNSDVVRLVNLYDLEGRGDEAARALQEIIDTHGSSAFVLRTLASHEIHHHNHARSLAAWDQYVASFGHDAESTLSRMELLWRLDRKDEAADASEQLKGNSLLTSASDYQLRLMAEIGWRYRKPWLTLLVRPQLEALEVEDQRTLFGRRSLELLMETGKDREALAESMQLWNSTGSADFAFTAMQLAVKVGDKDVQQQFQPGSPGSESLQDSPVYWAQLATERLQRADAAGAISAYERALQIDPVHIESIAGLLWTSIGEQDEVRLMKLLQEHRQLAEQTPALWQAMAMGYLQMGAASASLQWFDRLLDQIEADYAMLLTYADALEYAGRSASALKVRQYTLQQLRPLLVEGTAEEQGLLLRQYSRLSARYAGVEPNEQLMTHLLKTDADEGSEADDLWRQDMAISWLMATQQFEHARLVMAQLHARRMQAPVWQQVALALNEEDDAALNALVQASGPLSVGNHILALRQLGNEREAYAMVQQVMRPGPRMAGVTLDDLRVAQDQYVPLRDSRPSFVSGAVDSRNSGKLNINESGVRVRHTFAGQNLGMSLDMTRRRLDSDRYDVAGNEEQDDVALSLYFGNTRLGGRVTSGFLRNGRDDLMYANAAFAAALRDRRSRVSTELAYNESVELSPELIIGARQHRVSVAYDADIGRREFVRVQADATEISSRVEQSKVARGLGGSVELGMRGSFGSNNWSTSVRAAHLEHDREAQLPDELRLTRNSTMDSVLAEEVQSLSLGASLSRGGINADFPQVSSPRYFLSASVGQNWPDKVVGFQLGAGAGIRVLGGDELSFSLSHDTQPTIRRSGDTTALGVNYRYHFQ